MTTTNATMKPEKIKLVEINLHLTCYLCKGYYIDATTISECLHSFCRSCIIKFLLEYSFCPICEVIINKAKPNLKMDKTLQDIVYKLVPELFLNEMKRRQRFYEDHPNLTTKITPEERGEDTERTIFNPRDTISLAIEYISDDSTPGVILIPQPADKENDNNNKGNNQGSDAEENSAIKRFLQCPGMCRIEVLKKFIRNKYNVDTNQYYIDILYKRVPLPDHYTLIDIAYIYSWKRNEPMKFFFKITDIQLVTDSFDYLIQPQIRKELNGANQEMKTITGKTKETLTKEKGTADEKTKGTADDKTKGKEKEKLANTKIDQNNGIEPITKNKKVPIKNGLQVDVKVTVKKTPQKRKQSPTKELPDVDQEKSQFLKSFQLTAKSSLPNVPKPPISIPSSFLPPRIPPPPVPPPQNVQKRKNGSPLKTERPKKPKKSPNTSKSLQNPTVQQILSNVKQNGPNLPKIADDGNGDLQALLFDSYKINIPSSLSVTVKNEKDDPTPPSFQKPVQNYIEILKIPETPSPKPKSKPSEELIKPERSETKSHSKPAATYLVSKLNNTSRDFVKLNPRTPQTFQKMFEEAIRKPEFSNKFQTVPIVKTDSGPSSKPSDAVSPKRNILEIASKLYKKTKLDQEKNGEAKKEKAKSNTKKIKTPERGNPPLKDFNSYISSKSPQQTVTGLHSPSLGLNYTVSVAQTPITKTAPNELEVEIPSSSSTSKPNSPLTPSISPRVPPKSETPSPKSQTPLKKEAGTIPSIPAASKLAVNVVTGNGTENSQPLSPDKLLEKYNIQNLAQLSANFNFPQNLMNATNQLAAMQQAMIYRHFEMQNHHNWLNMNPGPLMQYEKYLKSLTKS